MVYSVGDFVSNLQEALKAEQRLGLVNMQSDEALEQINQRLPRNMMLKKIFLEEKEGDSILDVA